MKLTDEPRFVSLDTYEHELDELVQQLIGMDVVESVYQIGGVGTPGISDLDIVAVFRDNAKCGLDPLRGLAGHQRYLFIHSLYGTSRTHFLSARDYDFLHGYRLLYGPGETLSRQIGGTDEVSIKRQLALEFLLRMLLNVTLERFHGVLKVRSLLLHVKGLLYDLEFLNVERGAIVELVTEANRWRDSWFEQRPSDDEILRWHDVFSNELREFLVTQLEEYGGFYLPIEDEHRISRSVSIRNSKKVNVQHKGFRVPMAFRALGRNYRRLQNRLGTVVIETPFESRDIPLILARRFQVYRAMRDYNKQQLPHFYPLGSSLHAY